MYNVITRNGHLLYLYFLFKANSVEPNVGPYPLPTVLGKFEDSP